MKKHTINLAEFKKQVQEIAIGDPNCTIELGDDDSITMKIPVNLDPELNPEDQALVSAMENAGEDQEALIRAAVEAAGGDADDAIDLLRLHGFSIGDAMTVLGYQMREANERLGKFRMKKSPA